MDPSVFLCSEPALNLNRTRLTYLGKPREPDIFLKSHSLHPAHWYLSEPPPTFPSSAPVHFPLALLAPESDLPHENTSIPQTVFSSLPLGHCLQIRRVLDALICNKPWGGMRMSETCEWHTSYRLKIQHHPYPAFQRIPFTTEVGNNSVALSRGMTFLEHLLSVSPGEQPLGFIWGSFGTPGSHLPFSCSCVLQLLQASLRMVLLCSARWRCSAGCVIICRAKACD